MLTSPGERRSPELAAQGAANAGVRRERLALSVRQESVDRPAETGSPVSAYLNTALSAPLSADAVLLTGTKNTADDAAAAREAGLFEELRAFEGPVVGLCGGYQLLGERLTNAALESTGDPGEIPGAGLLPVETRFASDRTVERDLDGCGPLAGADGPVTGYEIHMGRTRLLGEATRPFEGSGAARDHVFGTYLHGLFENRRAREVFVDAVYESAGRTRPETRDERESLHDRAAALVSRLDLDALGL